MLTLIDFQKAMDEVTEGIKKLGGGKAVTVGIHEDAGAVEGGELTMAQLGAVHEFGAQINHPGGTSYGYASRAAAERGEVRFLGKGGKGRGRQAEFFGYAQPGVTEAHIIDIPARPWLVPGAESGSQQYLRVIESGLAKQDDFDSILAKVGVKAEDAVKLFMTNLSSPPNAPSTIAAKGSDNPLIDSGAMRASVTSVVQSGKLEEGL